MLPLHDLTVIALEQAVAAPFASRQLADLGARVVKIERPGVGDFARGYDGTVKGMSSHFVWLNRGKQSLTLNLKDERAREVLHKLLADADVLLQNLAPGATARLGFDGAELRARHPRLIVCNLSGYGESGPYRDKKAYDLLVQCETGLVSTTGTPDTPAKTGISTADIAGGMYAYSGILTALYNRERTGNGALLEVSLFDALGEWMGFPAYFTAYGGSAPRRAGASHSAIAPYGPFRCGDGGVVNLGIQNEREWQRFCAEVLEQPALVDDARFVSNTARVTNLDALRGLIEQAFAALTTSGVIERLDAVGIANARLNTMQEFWDHPQLQARDRWCEVDSPQGPIRALRPPVISEDLAHRMGAIPDVGEHTDTILHDLGYSDSDIAGLRDAGAV
jgi:crotonobetainyl-CoA:carnitine CoA-transferase CaiB-like acyl-CoA transferase